MCERWNVKGEKKAKAKTEVEEEGQKVKILNTNI